MEPKELTDREMRDWQGKIRRMEYIEMAVRYRFAPVDHILFITPKLHEQFTDRFNNYYGGMRAGISTEVGFDYKVWAGKYGLPMKRQL